MKHLMLSLLLFMGSMHLFAQKGKIEGVVVDKVSGEGIPYANIAVTDTSGMVEITQEAPRADMGEVGLAVSTVDLDEVEVRALARTASSKIDRRVYRAVDFEMARGGTAVDVLNKLPSVSVDPNGVVSVRGTADFMVYLNGKATQMEPSLLLAQLSGESIESIEVINVPTAKYDAQGKGGIININTRTHAQEGLSLSANVQLGGAPWGTFTTPYDGYSQNDRRYGGGLSPTYVKDRFSAYGSLYYSHRNVNGKRTGDARLLQSDGSYYHMVAGGERPEWYETYSASTRKEDQPFTSIIISTGMRKRKP